MTLVAQIKNGEYENECPEKSNMGTRRRFRFSVPEYDDFTYALWTTDKIAFIGTREY